MAKENNNRKLKGYYRFSKKYPSPRGTGYAIGESRKMKKKERADKILLAFLLCVFFAVAFVAAAVFIKLSARPLPEKHEDSDAPVTVEDIKSLKAAYIGNEALGDTGDLELALDSAAESGCNAVMLDFKNSEGVLTYSSSLMSAPEGAEYNEINQAVIEKIKSSGFMLVARIYCFEDSSAPQRTGAFVWGNKELTDIWFDAPAALGGRVWLNPASQKARDYLCSVISEVSSLDIDCVYLQSVCFPSSDSAGAPVFTEDDSSLNKNMILQQFLEDAASSARNVPLILSLNGDAREGDSNLYGGSLFDSAAAVCSPVISAPGEGDYAVYAAELCEELNESVKNNFTTIKVIPTLTDSGGADLPKRLTAAGVDSFIITP